jgi:hypothetical protein
MYVIKRISYSLDDRFNGLYYECVILSAVYGY